MLLDLFADMPDSTMKRDAISYTGLIDTCGNSGAWQASLGLVAALDGSTL